MGQKSRKNVHFFYTLYILSSLLKLLYLIMQRYRAALTLKEALGRISPIIEQYTSFVCPSCIKVCCANKHGIPEKEDIVFFNSISYEYRSARGEPDSPCEFLSQTGCVLLRWQRPFRCTWYFCGPLLEHMRDKGGREYRRLVEQMEQVVKLRREFLLLSEEG